MKNLGWKEYSASITISRSKDSGELLKKLQYKIAETKKRLIDCVLVHPFFLNYRRYKRGKNRCERCGCKIKDV